MEEGGLKHICTLLQAAAFEYDAAGGATDNSEENLASVQQGFCLSVSLLNELHDFFQSYDVRSSEIAGLWDELAGKNISAGGIVRILTGTMESGGMVGIKAADIYLSLLLFPGWPVYSLFSQMAFDSLARCLRNSCKASSKGDGGGQGSVVGGDRGKKGQRKGKRVREKEKPAAVDEVDDIDQAGQQGSSSEAKEIVRFENISSLLVKLQRTAVVLHLKERQETLKLIVGFLVDMQHLLGDMTEDQGDKNDIGGRGRKRAGLAPPTSAVPDVVFSTLGNLLGAMHGEPVTTAIMVLRALTPTILLTHTSGSGRVEIRNKTIHFVTKSLLTAGFALVRPAVVALPRYLCLRAPEKTDGRALAVESVLTVLQAFNSKDWSSFSAFLYKFSHSKPRHRLVAVDVALALVGGLPHPLQPLGPNFRHNSEQDQGEELIGDRSENGCPGDFRPEIEEQCGIDVDSGVECEEQESRRDNSQPNVQHCGVGSPVRGQGWGITCIEILLHRCSDKVPTIRARSLTNLAQAIELLSVDVSSRRYLQSLLGFNGNVSHGTGNHVRQSKSRLFSNYDTPVIGGETPSPEPSSDFPSATPLTPGAGHRHLWSLLQRRCLDDKAAVRKATFLLMKKSTALLGKAPEDAILHAMGVACGDAMISIRKVALSALSEVMRRFPGDAKVAKEWLKSALPLAFDNEQSLQDECLSLFEELVLDRITLISTVSFPRSKFQSTSGREASVPHEVQHEKDIERLLPVGAMSLLKEMADGSSISSCVKRICSSLGKKKRVRPGVALALQSLISAHGSPDGAWFLLSEVTAFVPKAVGWEFLRTHWNLLDKKDSSSTDNEPPPPQQQEQQQAKSPDANKPYGNMANWAVDRVHLLQTISNVAIELPPEAAADLASELLDRLKAFNMHPSEVGAHIKSLAILCKRKAHTAEEGEQLVVLWVKELLELAGNILQASLSPSFSSSTRVDDVFHTPNPTKGSTSVGTLTRSRSKHSHKEGRERSCKQKESSPQIVTAIFTIGALALICPQAKAGNVVTLLQTLLTPTRGMLGQRKCGEADKILLREKVTPEINVHVRVALGKLCLADDDLAKRCIPLFVHELGRADLAAVRNNTMIVMTDFCVRYTALIDGYIHDLTKSLRDSCELVRRQAFVLLSGLLQRDYVKWKGMLFHRFLLALVDHSEKISQLARYVFGSVLKTKAPLLAYNSFVEAIFVLNDCISQASSSALLQIPENERSLFCLRGDTEGVVDKRMTIYLTLIQQMVPEHLLATSAKLCSEILAAAADGLLDLNDGPSKCVLQDALRILASKELRITGARVAAGTADIEDEEGGAAAAMAAVKGRVVTQLMKKNLVQNAVPIFIELKRLLESRNSPLLGLLMECMRVMLKDYKNEIEEILVADKQLQKEILYDMQKHEAAKARATVAAAAGALPIQREMLQQTTPGVVQTPSSAVPVRSASASVGKATRDENIVDKDSQNQARRAVSGKENENPSPNVDSESSLPPFSKATFKGASNPPDITTRTPSFPSLKKSAVGKFLYGDARAGSSPSGAWQNHQTPRIRIHSAMPSSLSRLQPSGSHQTPCSLSHPHTSHFRRLSPTPGGPPVDPSDDPPCDSQDETCIAGAVAEVVAVSTVATVLQQVAQKSVTPFRTMSIPRLRSDLSSTNSALRGQRSTLRAEIVQDVQEQPLPEEIGLETVRRRQSFSSIDEPCGLPSQSDE